MHTSFNSFSRLNSAFSRPFDTLYSIFIALTVTRPLHHDSETSASISGFGEIEMTQKEYRLLMAFSMF